MWKMQHPAVYKPHLTVICRQDEETQLGTDVKFAIVNKIIKTAAARQSGQDWAELTVEWISLCRSTALSVLSCHLVTERSQYSDPRAVANLTFMKHSSDTLSVLVMLGEVFSQAHLYIQDFQEGVFK